jgi:hypothetical protein
MSTPNYPDEKQADEKQEPSYVDGPDGSGSDTTFTALIAEGERPFNPTWRPAKPVVVR